MITVSKGSGKWGEIIFERSTDVSGDAEVWIIQAQDGQMVGVPLIVPLPEFVRMAAEIAPDDLRRVEAEYVIRLKEGA